MLRGTDSWLHRSSILATQRRSLMRVCPSVWGRWAGYSASSVWQDWGMD